jgi:hypothetical protein
MNLASKAGDDAVDAPPILVTQDPTAEAPFYFNSSAHLLRIGREKADNLAELLDGLNSCPDESIFMHTFQSLEEHHFIREGFSNDFAQWAYTACNEVGLAERLSGVDIREFTSIQSLRERLVEVVEGYLKRYPLVRQRTAREAFYFCASETVVIPTSCVAHSLTEFVEALKKVSIHSIHHHFIDARLRLKLVSNDFSVWLEDKMSRPDLAHRFNRIDIYTATLEDVRERMVRILENAYPKDI